jgi:Putative metal-binding motif/Secretion system C-terminal sorting domain
MMYRLLTPSIRVIFLLLALNPTLFSQNFQFFKDGDADGFGDPNFGIATQQTGYVNNSQDCNDADASINPNTQWFADPDFDGIGAGNVFITCNPGDGWVRQSGDCDNSRASIRPGLAEICDGIDQNCDGQIDEGIPKQNYYRDADGDGFGNVNINTDPNNLNPRLDCVAPNGFVANNGDCNDFDMNIRPGVTDLCNGINEDCDTQTDEDGGGPTYYADADGDGFGNPSVFQQACTKPNNFVENATDCNDNNAQINPNALWFADPDFDGIGAGASLQTCNPGPGWSVVTGDCDNGSAGIRPGLAELCDGIDQNCDGKIDEGLPKVTYYRDADNDGFGSFVASIDPNMPNPVQDCTQRQGYVTNNQDCNDNDASITLVNNNSDLKLVTGGRIGHEESNCEPFKPQKITAQLPPTHRINMPALNCTFQWFKNDSASAVGMKLIVGATSATYRPLDTIYKTTFYVRYAQLPNSCAGDAKPSNWIMKKVGCLREGIANPVYVVAQDEAFHLFPNPVNERLYVLPQAENVGKSAKIAIFNTLGKVVYQLKIPTLTDESIAIDTEKLTEGQYWLTCEFEGKRVVRKAFFRGGI